MIPVAPGLAIAEEEIALRFLRASGPGGQNVNKVATAVQLRFDVRHSPSLPDEVRMRLERLVGARLSKAGVLVITAERFRTQERNRKDAIDRLIALLRRAAMAPKPRRPTKPTAASRRRRTAEKRHRATAKMLRGTPTPEE